MMVLCFICSFLLGICICIVFYIFVIYPCVLDNDKEFKNMLNEIIILKHRLNQDYETIKFQRKQLRSLQKAYDKLKHSYDLVKDYEEWLGE